MTTLSLSESKHQDLHDALQVIAAEYKKEEPKKKLYSKACCLPLQTWLNYRMNTINLQHF